jgi:hypothetical protein
LSEDDEADPEEEAAQYERNRYDPDWPDRANSLKKGVSAKKNNKTESAESSTFQS